MVCNPVQGMSDGISSAEYCSLLLSERNGDVYSQALLLGRMDIVQEAVDLEIEFGPMDDYHDAITSAIHEKRFRNLRTVVSFDIVDMAYVLETGLSVLDSSRVMNFLEEFDDFVTAITESESEDDIDNVTFAAVRAKNVSVMEHLRDRGYPVFGVPALCTAIESPETWNPDVFRYIWTSGKPDSFSKNRGLFYVHILGAEISISVLDAIVRYRDFRTFSEFVPHLRKFFYDVESVSAKYAHPEFIACILDNGYSGDALVMYIPHVPDDAAIRLARVLLERGILLSSSLFPEVLASTSFVAIADLIFEFSNDTEAAGSEIRKRMAYVAGDWPVRNIRADTHVIGNTMTGRFDLAFFKRQHPAAIGKPWLKYFVTHGDNGA